MQEPQTTETPQDGQDGYLSTVEAAAVLRVSDDTVRRHAPSLGGRKVLGRWRLDPQSVAAVASGGAQ